MVSWLYLGWQACNHGSPGFCVVVLTLPYIASGAMVLLSYACCLSLQSVGFRSCLSSPLSGYCMQGRHVAIRERNFELFLLLLLLCDRCEIDPVADIAEMPLPFLQPVAMRQVDLREVRVDLRRGAVTRWRGETCTMVHRFVRRCAPTRRMDRQSERRTRSTAGKPGRAALLFQRP